MFYLAEDRDVKCFVLRTVMKLRVPHKTAEFLNSSDYKRLSNCTLRNWSLREVTWSKMVCGIRNVECEGRSGKWLLSQSLQDEILVLYSGPSSV